MSRYGYVLTKINCFHRTWFLDSKIFLFLFLRADESDDIMLSAGEIKHIAMSIEEHLYRYFGDSGARYKHRNRYILYHIRDKLNKV